MRANSLQILIVCVCLLVVLQPHAARAVLLAYDDFNYSNVGGDLNTNGGGGSFGFSDSWSGQTSYNIANGSLVSPRDPLPRVGNSVSAVAFGENRGIDRNFPSSLGAENSSLYMSVLMQPIGILHQGAYDGWFGVALRGANGNAFVSIGMNYSQSNYGVRLADLYAQSNVAAVVGKTVFLVLRVDYTEGVDPLRLYVNPQPGAPEPTTANASLIDYDVQFFTQLSLTGPGGSAFDSVRIGTTFLDVAPPVADFNTSGKVDGADLDLWEANYGSMTASHSLGDTNDDLDVDGSDFLVWQRQLGAMDTVPAVNAIPEPEAWMLGIGGALVASSQRRRASPFAH